MPSSLEHWLREIGSRPTAAEVEAALRGLVVEREGDVARIGRGLFGAIPTSQGRTRALARAAAGARKVVVHAPAAPQGAFVRGRLAIDLPRRALRCMRVPVAEPGDRFDGRFVHVFFDDEPIADEGEKAGLRFVSREGEWVTFEPAGRDARALPDDSFRRELLRAVLWIGTAERLRLRASPEAAVGAMRQRGRRARARTIVGRARLRRAIGWVDAAFPSGPNCFRRVLTEIALDGGAAAETLVFGLDVGRTGHVAFAGTEARAFDVAFEIR